MKEKRKGSFPTKFAYKKAQLKNHILARSLLMHFWSGFGPADVIRAEDYHGKRDVRVMLEFFNYGTAFIWLFVQDDRVKFELGKKPPNLVLASVIMAMHDKHFASNIATHGASFIWRGCNVRGFLLQFGNPGSKIRLGDPRAV